MEVACAIIEKQGVILAAQRSATMRQPLKWEFPGGKLEEQESPEACIVREIREELHILVNPIHPLPQQTTSSGIILYPLVCQFVQGALHLSEHAQVLWRPAMELVNIDWIEADAEILQNYLEWKG